MSKWLKFSGPCAAVALGAAAALAQTGSSASVTVSSGPHKGEYNFAPTETCVIAGFSDKPVGISVVMQAADSSLSIDMPSIDAKHANEIQVVLVIADRQGAGKKSSVSYAIDTRPDSALDPLQRAERANKGISGKATTTLMEKDGSALLSFSGQTAAGVKLEGSVTCRKMI